MDALYGHPLLSTDSIILKDIFQVIANGYLFQKTLCSTAETLPVVIEDL
jgi:hypothetical protein